MSEKRSQTNPGSIYITGAAGRRDREKKEKHGQMMSGRLPLPCGCESLPWLCIALTCVSELSL
jgi:hypothetical protein